MWLCDPEIMCQKHLCGEHLEMHMFLGAIKKGKKIDGYLNNNLLEPLELVTRHNELADEMINRGYKHRSAATEDDQLAVVSLEETKRHTTIDRELAFRDLMKRCPECRKNFVVQ
jgi:hypothetical protein